MKGDMDSISNTGPDADDAGEVEPDKKQISNALTQAFDHFFASLELISGTRLEFEGHEDEWSQSVDDVTSLLFREEELGDTERQE